MAPAVGFSHEPIAWPRIPRSTTMGDRLLPGVGIQDLPDGGVRYRLHVWKGWAAVVVAVFLLLFGISVGCAGAGGTLMLRAFGLPGLAVAAALLIVLVLGVPVILYALWLLAGHTILAVQNSELSKTWRLGPLPLWNRRWPLARVRSLAVISDGRQQLVELVAIGDDCEPLGLAAMCPYDSLWQLAHDLAWRCNGLSASEPVEVFGEWTDFTGERTEQPVRSRIVVHEDEEGLSFVIPAATMRSEALLLFVFGGVWSIIVFSIAAVVAAVVAAGALQGAAIGLPALILVPFVLVGLVLMAVALHIARRRVSLHVCDGELTVRREGLFGKRERHWTREDLVTIAATQEWRRQRTHNPETGATTTTYHLVTQLRLHATDGSVERLEGRYGMHALTVSAEWEWLATRLREALGVSG
jgi:hypothetical protein